MSNVCAFFKENFQYLYILLCFKCTTEIQQDVTLYIDF